ncbi:MAG: hypothetical protein QNJ78_12350 [Gammaproteobacteria bacterium]|nr:hypothetical protein [Gammaproteobacteria bacterium]
MQLRIANTAIYYILFLLTLVLIEPAFANKFETIGSGVAGSNKIKIEYLKTIAYVAGAILLVSGILSLLLRDKNSQHLNYTMWKSSAFIFFILGLLVIVIGYFL